MNFELLAALAAFAFIGSITPGPNTMMLLASGLNHGIRATIPHIAGISIGVLVMLLAVGFGLGQIFTAYPAFHTGLKVVSVVYLLWLAWRIATTQPAMEKAEALSGRPMTFLQAAAFQWVNPKAWTLCITIAAAYTLPEAFATSLTAAALIFAIVNLPCGIVWTSFGVTLRRFLSDPRRVRIFNVSMALALVASLWPLITDLLKLTIGN